MIGFSGKGSAHLTYNEGSKKVISMTEERVFPVLGSLALLFLTVIVVYISVSVPVTISILCKSAGLDTIKNNSNIGQLVHGIFLF